MGLRLLGTVEVHDGGGRPIPLGGPRQRAVLVALALHAGEVVSTDRLVDEVWDGEPPASAVRTLQRYLSHLRKALDGTVVALESRAEGYVLLADPDDIDARRFERLAVQGSAVLDADPEAASRLLAEALDLWAGPALGDLAGEPFARIEAAQLDELRLVAIERRFEAELACGCAAEAVPPLERLVAEHPLREAARALLMRALHQSGRTADALRAYEDGRRTLAEELGLDPGRALRDLEQAILQQDPSLEAPDRAAPSGHLPAALDRFVGRERETAAVEALLGRSRLVTLTGTGGTGKTRLSLHVAERRPGAWFVELSPVRDPSLVEAAFASALGVREDGDGSMLDAVVDAVRRRVQLLVVDNCEQVLDAAAEVVVRLLRECPNVQVLASSREALNVRGEATYVVPTLSPAEATELFAERAREASGAFDVDERAAATVAGVCATLDGIPLAIELAAARLRVLSLDEIATRLDDRFSLLTTGDRVSEDRQRTLRGALEWSHDLLSAEEREAYAGVSVFAGSFDAAAAEAVAGAGLYVVASLLAKSLLVRVDDGTGRTRYRMLETVRTHAAEARPDDVVERHLAWVLAEVAAVVDDLVGREGPRARARIAELQEDVRAALARLLSRGRGREAQRLAGAMWIWWDQHFQLREGRSWIERALDADPTPSPERLAALVGLSKLAFLDDDEATVREAGRRGFELAASLGDHVAEAKLLNVLADLSRVVNDPDEASIAAERARARFAEAGESWWEANSLRTLALLAWDEGDLARAEELAQGALDRWSACGDVEQAAGATSMLAGFAVDRGDHDRGRDLYETALAGFRDAGEPSGEAMILRSLGTLAWRVDDPARALELAEEARALCEEIGYDRGVAESVHLMAQAVLDLGDVERAAALADDALERFRRRGFAGDIAVGLQTAARVAFARGDPDRAARLCDEALVPYREQGAKRHAAGSLCLLGLVTAQRGDVHRGVELLGEGFGLFAEAGDRHGMARAFSAVAELATDGALAGAVARWRLELGIQVPRA